MTILIEQALADISVVCISDLSITIQRFNVICHILSAGQDAGTYRCAASEEWTSSIWFSSPFPTLSSAMGWWAISGDTLPSASTLATSPALLSSYVYRCTQESMEYKTHLCVSIEKCRPAIASCTWLVLMVASISEWTGPLIRVSLSDSMGPASPLYKIRWVQESARHHNIPFFIHRRA